ncbi:STAS domain-containing protein [Saprospira sp. CCB-QB6]|uniref:STAS domain-containing protein n=1 Tax=Saprospira sp. CCB-QB6 TaxID=3023936 RepID=UPI002348EF62|nr:STAS domain-containing protein [Saprospira sp. CCB-QB6]WCL81087.1 STAS domain-containing protein [Saprospira sp. CCB-QB6]
MSYQQGEFNNLEEYQQAYFLTDEEIQLIQDRSQDIPFEEYQDRFDQTMDWMREGELRDSFPPAVVEATIQARDFIIRDVSTEVLSEGYLIRHAGIRRQYLELGVSLKAFTTLLVRFHESIFSVLEKHYPNDAKLAAAYKKYNLIDLDILAKEYRRKTQQDLEEQNKALRELSTPVAQIWENILLLPLVGFIDSKRSKDIMEAMLDKIADSQAKFFILDISGVAIVDTAVANHLIKMTKAARLMGAKCIISGISGNIAQTIVELGIVIDEIETTGSMKDALKLAIKESGNQL